MSVPLMSMEEIASRYQTIVTQVSPAPGAYRLVLAGNPRRFYWRLLATSGAGSTPVMVPGPLPSGLSPFTVSLDQQYKFNDCPSLVTGEWYVQNTAALTFLIVECVYLD